MEDYGINLKVELDDVSAKQQLENLTKDKTISLKIDPKTLTQLKNLQATISSIKVDKKALTDIQSKLKIKVDIDGINIKSNSNIERKIQNQIKQVKPNNVISLPRGTQSILATGVKQSQISSANINFKTLENNINALASRPNEIGMKNYEQLSVYIARASDAKHRLNEELNKGENANLDTINQDLKEFTTLTRQATNRYNKFVQPIAGGSQTNSIEKAQAWLSKNSKVTTNSNNLAEFNKIIDNMRNATTEGRLKEATSDLSAFQARMQSTGQTGLSLSKELTRGFKQIGQFATTYGLWVRILDTAYKAID